jgi:uncharacterized FlaG/YvyC family protein
MTKTEIKKHINKSVYEFATALGYQMSDDNDGSYVTFSKSNFTSYYDTIDYHRSYQEAMVMKGACDESVADADKINEFVKALKADIEFKKAIMEGDVE